MTRPTTLAEAWEQMLADEPATTRTPAARVRGRRDFMAGALAALALQRQGSKPDALLSECMQFGRAVGTAAEAAQ